MALVPRKGPRPSIIIVFDELLAKLEAEERADKGFNPEVAMAVVDWWIAGLLLTRSYIQNHAAGGKDFDLAPKR